jgi:hypothetical protein
MNSLHDYTDFHAVVDELGGRRFKSSTAHTVMSRDIVDRCLGTS